MSHMTLCVDNSVPPKDRRVGVRYPLGALAYLDIGADNGGIVLNVSEAGLALQAVGPLEQQKEVSLRIQLPHSEKRIETAARIVWLSKSNRQAGVRFVAMTPAARAQIQQWMDSQPVSDISEEGSTDHPTERVTLTTPPTQAAGESQTDKWLSLMADFAARQPVEASSGGPTPPLPADAESVRYPVSHPKPEIVSREFGRQKPRDPGSSSATESATSRAPGASGAPPSAAPDKKHDSLIVTPAPKLLATSTAISAPVSSPVKAVGDSAEAARNAVRNAAKIAAGRTRTRNQIAVAAAVVVFSIVCFGIGTWVGNLINRQPAALTVAAPATPAIVAQNNATRSPGVTKPPEPASPISREKRLSERTRPRTAAPHRKQTAASPNAEAALTAQLPRENAVAAPVSSNPSPAQRINSASNASAMQPSPVDFVQETAAPRVIDGRILKPSDRFNPCHLTYRVEPTYPQDAEQQGIQGTVKVHLVIAADGSVETAKLISGPSQLAPAALDATKYWRYFPALLNGQPVQTEKDVEVAFHLPR